MIRNPTVIVFLLTGLNLLNYLDRYLIAAISPNIQRDLALTDGQVGLIGSAFLWGYLLTSPIFGRLGDVMMRKLLITVGVMIWCGATAGSGLAHTFAAMWGVRLLVGVGEASYASLSPTIIDDVTPPERKGRVLAIFYAAIPIGSALGYVLGGELDKRFGWRSAFFIAGGPGVLLALSCLLIAEPPRAKKEASVPMKLALKGVLGSKRYLWATLGFIGQTFALGGFSFWAPQYLHRKFAMELDEANFIFGAIVIVTGFVGTFVGGAWADKIPGADRVRPALRVCAISTIFAVPFAFVAVFAPSKAVFFGAMALAQLGIFASTSPINAVFLGSVPTTARALAMALSIFAGHLLGDMISVWLVGELSDLWQDLSGAMIVLPAALLMNAIAWWFGERAPALSENEEAPQAA